MSLFLEGTDKRKSPCLLVVDDMVGVDVVVVGLTTASSCGDI